MKILSDYESKKILELRELAKKDITLAKSKAAIFINSNKQRKVIRTMYCRTIKNLHK